MRSLLMALTLAATTALTPDTAAQDPGEWPIHYEYNNCPAVIPQDAGEGGGGPYIDIFSKSWPQPNGWQDLYLFSNLGLRPGALLIGLEAAQWSRNGCPLMFTPLVALPIFTNHAGELNLGGRWPNDPALYDLEVYVQAYLFADVHTGFVTSNTMMYEFWAAN